jgi:predicted ATPase
MKKLSRKMQMGLKFAACLGPIFEAKVLEKAKKNNEFEDSFLESCIEFGLLQNPGSNLGQFVWAHDQIQQAAYDLIPLSKREAFHLLVGSRMFVTTSSHEMEDMIFFIVDNLNRGVKL